MLGCAWVRACPRNAPNMKQGKRLSLQVRLWRLPQLSASTGSSSELVGSVTALAPVQPWEGQALGSLAWMAAPGMEPSAPLLVAGNADNSSLALYSFDEDAAELQLLQVWRFERDVQRCQSCFAIRAKSIMTNDRAEAEEFATPGAGAAEQRSQRILQSHAGRAAHWPYCPGPCQVQGAVRCSRHR